MANVRPGREVVGWNSGAWTKSATEQAEPARGHYLWPICARRLESVERWQDAVSRLANSSTGTPWHTISVLQSSRRSVVVTAFPLKAPGRAKLAEQLGDVDCLTSARLSSEPTSCWHRHESAVRGSAQRGLSNRSDSGRRAGDCGLQREPPRPVDSILNAGADAYLLADSIEQSAQQLQPRPNHSVDQDAKTNDLYSLRWTMRSWRVSRTSLNDERLSPPRRSMA